MVVYSLKNDAFRAARGGYARLLNIHCRKCKQFLFAYQKDGPGNIRRLYLDRIISLEKSSPILKCGNCRELLGTSIIYHKEVRPAYRLYQDAVVKKTRKVTS